MTLMQRRRALMAVKKGGSRLPAEFQEVEYVKNPSAGGAYFSTNVQFGNPFHIHAVVQKDTTWTGYDRVFIGSRGGSKNYNTCSIRASGNYVFAGCVADSGNCLGLKTVFDATFDGEKHIFVQNSLGEFSNIANDSSNINPASNIMVFWQNLTATQFSGGRIYDLYVENPSTGNKVMHLIPCYRKSDNKTGMYDVIGNSFYYSSGTSDFEKGADV